mgnify:CR=1 FL=1
MKGIIRKGMLAFAATAIACFGIAPVSAAALNLIDQTFALPIVHQDIQIVAAPKNVADGYFVKQVSGADGKLGVKFWNVPENMISARLITYGIGSAQIGDQGPLDKDSRAAGYAIDIGSGYSHPMRC